jgi:CheY-like chemotaxis protein
MRARTVLVVSPRAKIRAAARGLARPSLAVLEATTGLGALVVCAAHAVDLVLLDETAPGMDAPRLIQKLSDAFPDLAVEAVSADPAPQVSAYFQSAPRKAVAYAWLPDLREQRGA